MLYCRETICDDKLIQQNQCILIYLKYNALEWFIMGLILLLPEIYTEYS